MRNQHVYDFEKMLMNLKSTAKNNISSRNYGANNPVPKNNKPVIKMQVNDKKPIQKKPEIFNLTNKISMVDYSKNSSAESTAVKREFVSEELETSDFFNNFEHKFAVKYVPVNQPAKTIKRNLLGELVPSVAFRQPQFKMIKKSTDRIKVQMFRTEFNQKLSEKSMDKPKYSVANSGFNSLHNSRLMANGSNSDLQKSLRQSEEKLKRLKEQLRDLTRMRTQYSEKSQKSVNQSRKRYLGLNFK